MENTAFAPEETIRYQIADNVAAELARHRYSKRAAALALGMSPLYLYRRLSGDVEFGGSDLAAIADLLGIEAGVFFSGNSKTPSSAKVASLASAEVGAKPQPRD